jgi:hypothetical protein
LSNFEEKNFQIFENFQKLKFQSLLQQKLLVASKTFPGPKNFYKSLNFRMKALWCTKIIFGDYKAKNVILKKVDYFLKKFFQAQILQALEKMFFSYFENTTSQLLPAFSPIKKYLKLANLCTNESLCQTADFDTIQSQYDFS